MYLKPNRKVGQRTCGHWQMKKGGEINGVCFSDEPQGHRKTLRAFSLLVR